MKWTWIVVAAVVFATSCGPSKTSSDGAVEYDDLTWDSLLSEGELEYYLEEMRRFDADPLYAGNEEGPPLPEANADLDGMTIRIPGFTVGVDTVEGVYNKSKAFLFVPYQGACIHVPPPPPNQTIFVEMKDAVTTDPYIPIYLEGTIYVETGQNELASYFYRIDGDDVAPYEG